MTSNSRRGGVFGTVMIAVLAVVVVIAAGLIYTGIYVARNVKVTQKDLHGQQTIVETPFGTVRVRERSRLDPKHLGIPVYPGAVRTDDNKLAGFDLDTGDIHKSVSLAIAEYTTPDPLEKVRDFYREELGQGWPSVKMEKHGGRWQFEVQQDGYRRFIVLRAENGETHIGLASAGEPAAN